MGEFIKLCKKNWQMAWGFIVILALGLWPTETGRIPLLNPRYSEDGLVAVGVIIFYFATVVLVLIAIRFSLGWRPPNYVPVDERGNSDSVNDLDGEEMPERTED